MLIGKNYPGFLLNFCIWLLADKFYLVSVSISDNGYCDIE